MQIDQKNLSWLVGCPASDMNFKMHLRDSNILTIRKALENKSLTKTAINSLNIELRRKEKTGENETLCSGCGSKLSNSKQQDNFIPCPKCGKFTPAGSAKIKKEAPKMGKQKIQLCEGVTLESKDITLKEQLINFMKGKAKVNLAEIYTVDPSKKDNIRAILNISVKKGTDFKRIGRGEYTLI